MGNSSPDSIAHRVSRREAAYLVAGFIVLSGAIVGAMTHWDPLNSTTFGGDPAFYLWALKWWPHSLLSLQNPFYAPISYPDGQNLAWTTSAPALALIATPVTLLAGPILALNAMNMAALAANGILVYLICKDLDCKKSHALLAALLFYFSSYTWGQLLGHLSIVVTAFAIAFVYLTLRRAYGRIGRGKYIVVCIFLLAAQFWTSVELYATLVFFTGIVFFIFVLSLWRHFAWRKTVSIACDLCLAVCGSLVLIAPYLYQMFTHYVSNLQDISQYVADPVNYVVPTSTNWLLGHAFDAASVRFAGNISEQNVYLSLPLVVLLAVAGRNFYSNPLNRALLISLVVIALCSFGPRLTLLGVPTIQLPWYWIEKLPLIREALPTRFGLYTSLLAAVLAGRILTAVPKWDTKLLAVASLCLLLPNLKVYWPGKVPEDSFFSSGEYKSVIPKGAQVLVLPTYELGGYQPALWQLQSNFWFALTDSPVPVYASTRAKYPSLFAPNGNPAGYPYELLRFMKATGTQFVLTDDGEQDAITRAFRTLRFPYHQYGRVRVSDISEPVLERKIAKVRGSSFATVCASLVRLAAIGSDYVSEGSATSSLTPSSVANTEFDSRFGKPLSPTSSAANWTTNGYWLGGWADTIAVGVSPVDSQVASRLYASFRDEAREIYFPYPKAFHGAQLPEESGQFLVVLKDRATLSASCGG